MYTFFYMIEEAALRIAAYVKKLTILAVRVFLNVFSIFINCNRLFRIHRARKFLFLSFDRCSVGVVCGRPEKIHIRVA